MTKGKPLHEIIEEYKGSERRTQNLAQTNAKLRDELRLWKKKARYDRLTGLLRRETFDDLLAKLVQRADKFEKPLSLLMIDIDDFKSINDTKMIFCSTSYKSISKIHNLFCKCFAIF